MNRHFPGKWRITEMEDFAQDDVDLCGPASITFDTEGRGEFMFIAVQASMDCSYGQTVVHFKFEGSDEGDEVFGEGWAELDEGCTNTLTGCFEFRDGDDFEFKARKV